MKSSRPAASPRRGPPGKSGARGAARRVASLGGVAVALAALAPACSQGEGEGRIVGTLDAPDCWTGAFELEPDFLAAVPYRDALTLRIQSGSDFQNFSDGLTILINDRTQIRPEPSRGFAGRYREPLPVDLPPAVTPPGMPVRGDASPALVNMTLYLQRSCRTQTVTLQAVDEVTIPADGTCTAPALRGSDPTQGCAPDAELPAGVGSGKSVIAFTSVSNGRLDEETAAERLNAGCFDVYLADPREATPDGPPPPCRGHIRGSFSFFFERGRPSQPFP
ncbi:MAG: hypothetical protein KF850_08625 [Labilithrix sp.]|nr:hypothetical protein [Labilithrix sp.]